MRYSGGTGRRWTDTCKVLFPEGLSERAALLMDSHGSRNRGISRLNTEMNILRLLLEEV